MQTYTYSITLTQKELEEIKDSGDGRDIGDNIYKFLCWGCSIKPDYSEDYHGDLTFHIPKNIAKEMVKFFKDSNFAFMGYDTTLAGKLFGLYYKIVVNQLRAEQQHMV